MSQTYFLFGLPGVGKSTVLNQLNESQRIATFDIDKHLPKELKDDIRDGKLVDKDRWKTFHNDFLSDIKRESKFPKVVATNLILDADRDTVAKQYPDATWLHLHVPKDELRERLQNRDNHFFNPEIFNDLHELHYPIEHNHIEIDATQPPQNVTAQIKNTLF